MLHSKGLYLRMVIKNAVKKKHFHEILAPNYSTPFNRRRPRKQNNPDPPSLRDALTQGMSWPAETIPPPPSIGHSLKYTDFPSIRSRCSALAGPESSSSFRSKRVDFFWANCWQHPGLKKKIKNKNKKNPNIER